MKPENNRMQSEVLRENNCQTIIPNLVNISKTSMIKDFLR